MLQSSSLEIGLSSSPEAINGIYYNNLNIERVSCFGKVQKWTIIKYPGKEICGADTRHKLIKFRRPRTEKNRTVEVSLSKHDFKINFESETLKRPFLELALRLISSLIFALYLIDSKYILSIVRSAQKHRSHESLTLVRSLENQR